MSGVQTESRNKEDSYRSVYNGTDVSLVSMNADKPQSEEGIDAFTEAMLLLDHLQIFAYQNGFHECGYNPVTQAKDAYLSLSEKAKALEEDVDRLQKELKRTREWMTQSIRAQHTEECHNNPEDLRCYCAKRNGGGFLRGLIKVK